MATRTVPSALRLLIAHYRTEQEQLPPGFLSERNHGGLLGLITTTILSPQPHRYA